MGADALPIATRTSSVRGNGCKERKRTKLWKHSMEVSVAEQRSSELQKEATAAEIVEVNMVPADAEAELTRLRAQVAECCRYDSEWGAEAPFPDADCGGCRIVAHRTAGSHGQWRQHPGPQSHSEIVAKVQNACPR